VRVLSIEAPFGAVGSKLPPATCEILAAVSSN
jgi:hypothetical protein